MTPISQPVTASGLARWAFSQFKHRRVTRSQLVATGEVLFVGGWSLMWATSLGFLPRVPAAIWLTMMIAGLLLACNERTAK